MVICKIELENIKKYENLEVSFTEGLNFISGKNGAGKTTIIESIGFAIFDYQITSGKFSSYFIRKGQKKGRVRVHFLDKDDNYLIADRKISESSSGSSWTLRTRDEEIIADKAEDIMAYLKDHLEFYLDDDITNIYRNMISVPQGEFTLGFMYSGAERKKTFDPIFKLDSLKKAYSNIKLEKGIKDKITSMQIENSKLLGEISEKDQVIELKKLKEEELKKEEELFKNIRDNAESIKAKFEAMNKSKSEIDKISGIISSKQTEINGENKLFELKDKELISINSSIVFLKDNEKSYKEYKDLDKNIELKDKECLAGALIDKELTKLKERSITGADFTQKAKLEYTENNEKLKKNMSEIDITNKSINEITSKINKEKDSTLKDNTGDDKDSNKDNNSNLAEMKNSLSTLLEYKIKLDNIAKEVKKSLDQKMNPEKEGMYLNKVKVNLESLEEYVAYEGNSYLVSANENLKKAMESSSFKSKNESSILDDLLAEKEKIENDFIVIYNKYMIDKVAEISRGENEAKNLYINFEKYIKSLEEKASSMNDESIKDKVMLENLNKDKLRLETEIGELNKKLSEIKANGIKYKNALADIEKKIVDLKPEYEKYEKAKKDLEELKLRQKNLKAIYEDYIVKEKDKTKLPLVTEEVNLIKEKIKLHTEELNRLLKDKDALDKNFNLEDFEKVKEEDKKVTMSLSAGDEKLKFIGSEIEKYKERLELFTLKEKEIKEKEKLIEEHTKAIEVVKKIRNVINKAPERISDLLIRNISLKASDIYSEVARDSNRLEWENSYELALYDNLNKDEVRKEFKQLSGGEQMTAALSVRLAMVLMLTKSKLVILDEPTANMDVLRRAQLAEIIETLSSQFRQLIVVSHDDTFENITENIITLGGKINE